jgi:NAD(P)-dependent dehydrogenase (short-subunit alcohol dehydrogenase family)
MAGKVVLVAGGTGGLGRAVSLAFVEAGARVVVTFRKPGDLDELKKAASAKLVASGGASLEGFAVDVTDEAAVAKLIDGIVERHERLDCMVNAVGGYAGGIKLWEMETKVFEQQMALNLRAGFVLAGRRRA